MSRRLAVLHSLTSTWCPCSYSRHWQKLSPFLWTKWHRLPLSLHTGGIICSHIFLSSLISDLITIPNWEDLLDDDVNRKPIWWQGFWKMMQNSGFQALNMSWNVLKCSELSFQELDKPLSSSNTATRLLAWAWPSIHNPTSIYLKSDISYKRDCASASFKVEDRLDGKLVHLDGLNFSRAWALYRFITFVRCIEEADLYRFEMFLPWLATLEELSQSLLTKLL